MELANRNVSRYHRIVCASIDAQTGPGHFTHSARSRMMVCVHSRMSARKKAGFERRRFVAWASPFAKMMPVLPQH